MKRSMLVPAFGFALAALPSVAGAQPNGPLGMTRPSYVDDDRQPYYDVRRTAYDNGYREGLKEGEKDGRSRDAFEYQDERAWRNGDKGYRRSLGDRGRYQLVFRSGFADGYADGYRRLSPGYGYGGYGNTGRAIPRRVPAPYPNTTGRYPGTSRYPAYPGSYGQYGYGQNAAYANGVNDGYEKGAEDARDRDSYDPLRHRWYRSGDRHYRNEYGPKAQYQNVYREGFREGYERGYRGYRR